MRSGRTLKNGAGKSTLDEHPRRRRAGAGRRRDAARRRALRAAAHRARTRARAGIAFIHQELNLFPNLAVAENLFIAGFPRRRGLIDRAALAERTAALLGMVSLALPPDTLVERLSRRRWRRGGRRR